MFETQENMRSDIVVKVLAAIKKLPDTLHNHGLGIIAIMLSSA
jgi:hypothetical protein